MHRFTRAHRSIATPKRVRRLGCGARTATRSQSSSFSFAAPKGVNRNPKHAKLMLLRCLRPTVAGPPASRRGGSAQLLPERGTARQGRVRRGVTPCARGRTHPLALPFVALGPNGQLLERCGVSKRAGTTRSEGARTSVTRMTNTCATQRCVLLVKRKLPSSWRAGGPGCGAASAQRLAETLRQGEKAESRAAPARVRRDAWSRGMGRRACRLPRTPASSKLSRAAASAAVSSVSHPPCAAARRMSV